jgi:hypothetical protein
MSMVAALVDLQQAVTVDQLRATRLPDWRSSALLAAAHELCSRKDVRATLVTERSQTSTVWSVSSPIDLQRWSVGSSRPSSTVTSIQATGAARRGTWCFWIWGDSGIGHPLLDMPAFLERMPEESASSLQDRWLCLLTGQARRASDLIAPIAALRQALIYRSFLDQIEPAERRYHAADVPLWLGKAITSSGHGS